MNNKELLIEKINRLRKEKNAVIMAHYYQIPEIQDIADFIGDSLALAQQALKVKADVIVLAGVYFMAETAKILNPEKKVIIPDPLAGCSLADSCPVDSFSEFRSRYPDAIVVSYVNTSAEIKALTDIVCTSSNAEQIINAIPKDKQIIFAPDRNLGNYLAAKTGRNLIIWDGACHVHEDFSLERILELKKQNPDAKIIAHPECKKPILIIADHVGSTSSLLAYVQKDSGRKYIVATESGIIHQMKAACPDKVFLTAPPTDSTCGCNDCRFMKLITLDKIYRSLETLSPEVIVDEQIRVKAEKSIKAMLDITAGKPVFSTL
ncbi:MAG TPA: quinolinate synthase NadA [Bacteroidales bacterium]|nr:quinolinate synthase NadA [Bacteroidales bacterium]